MRDGKFHDKLYGRKEAMNYKYNCLNPIANVGLANLTDNYARTENFAEADAVFVRSAKMDELVPGANLLAVAAEAAAKRVPKKITISSSCVTANSMINSTEERRKG